MKNESSKLWLRPKPFVFNERLRCNTVFLMILKRDRDRRVTISWPSRDDHIFQTPLIVLERPTSVHPASMSERQWPSLCVPNNFLRATKITLRMSLRLMTENVCLVSGNFHRDLWTILKNRYKLALSKHHYGNVITTINKFLSRHSHGSHTVRSQ
jgi:hypothetical protein